MAEIKQGILGVTRGKIGPVVGYIWRGKNWLRSKPSKSRKKATAKQLLQWDKMSLVSTYASKFRDFVNAHCPTAKVGDKWLIGKEQLISRMMKQGITMINGLQHIAVEQTILSIGNLAPAVIRKINIMKTGKFKVQWDNSLVNAMTLDTDSLTMMLYNETLDKFVAIYNVGNRVEKYAHFSAPTEWKSGKVYFWSMWKAADGSMHSTSCFHGMIELIEEQETGKREQETGHGKQGAGNGKQEIGKQEIGNRMEVVENVNQEKGNTKQEITEVLPVEQVQRIALKQCLEEVSSTTNVEIATKSVEPAIKEKKLKKWTPPGYTRRVTKRILKGKAEIGNNTEVNKKQSSSKPSGIIEGARSILDVPDIRTEQKE
ncbi:DUF6266 family protein [Myroides sp. N17-2]|uniref:DUF6266 family protein n=1 Tax=Myroides sp. N17-2 TaxID=2030799 RepID=UPI000EFAC0FE|nr:DUF6266 family protein [Myroides sp. N17-2]